MRNCSGRHEAAPVDLSKLLDALVKAANEIRADDVSAASADEAVSIDTVRNELTQIIAMTKQLAVESRGAARGAATERAMAWGAKWCAI